MKLILDTFEGADGFHWRASDETGHRVEDSPAFKTEKKAAQAARSFDFGDAYELVDRIDGG